MKIEKRLTGYFLLIFGIGGVIANINMLIDTGKMIWLFMNIVSVTMIYFGYVQFKHKKKK